MQSQFGVKNIWYNMVKHCLKGKTEILKCWYDIGEGGTAVFPM